MKENRNPIDKRTNEENIMFMTAASSLLKVFSLAWITFSAVTNYLHISSTYATKNIKVMSIEEKERRNRPVSRDEKRREEEISIARQSTILILSYIVQSRD
jgi:hypothetical protein